ncbi:EP1-like glycoprotein 3 [Citrus sinensis]|uniref:EP1-like glycoprotein 3 n=1 Tax=Citrus sinensis TaxID=2711 RepID=A0ACB8M030_CITSI|nr:EP1-like glycoprotein 3 [Citrus sinensis]
MASSSAIFSLFFYFLVIFSIANAQVPADETFKFVNGGEFGPFINEYDADYRMISIFNSPFQRNEPNYRWVWEANRGKPVRENATFSLGTDGNLVLAEADGTVVWQSNTANCVVGFKLLPNGNMVLHDSKGNFIWQSFDYPTDTLLVGQSVRVGGVTKLVSRLSVKENVDGPYSIVMESNRLSFYCKSSNAPRPVVYFTFPVQFNGLKNVTFNAAPETDEAFAYQLTLDSSSGGNLILARPKYNATISFLRLSIDGNIRIFTYYEDSIWETECQLPERCGKLGVCEDNQCVACPTEKGLLRWSKECEAKKVTSCRPNDFHYYKVDGVYHYLSKYTRGTSTKIEECGKKCTSDCKCLGYFYHQETSRCWIAYDLKTLTKFPNSSHVGFIKVPNK